MFYLVIFAVLVGVLWYLKRANQYWKRQGIYQAEPELFFGNSRPVVLQGKPYCYALLERYQQFKKAKLRYGGIYLFTIPTLVVIDPALIKQMLLKDFNHFMNRGLYHTPKDVLSMNLVNIEDELWRTLRTKLTPTFTSGKMKMMFETLLEKTVGLERSFGEYADSKEVCPIRDILARFTTDIIGSCAFGIECNSLENPDNVFRQFGKRVFEHSKWKVVLVSLIPWWLLGMLNYKEDGVEVANFFSNLVKDTISYREKTGMERKDFMHLLLELKNNASGQILTENEIIAQCYIFFLAGFETSSTTLTFALSELAQHQDIQSKLRDEIETTLAQHGGKLTYEAVMKMTYLEKVINETLRRYPPVPLTQRVATSKYHIPGTNHVLDKGVVVQIPIWGLHMDPEYYPNPEVFNPEHFSEENKASRPDFTFLPFGEGPRMCIGLRFGKLQTKVGLISLIRKYNFTLNEKTKIPLEMAPSEIVMALKDDVWVNVRRI
ncbi:putative cytochrome P450 6a20 [Rhynchophorus ferrugineus]|uniref:putative cytochrome P450 6a20 n=1 Tax=Rhynchophorus ferrugineus TaxID=354439 RepID=UPI003FCCADD4